MGANDVFEQLAFQTPRVGFVDRQVVLPRGPGEHLWTKEGHQEEEHQAALGTKQAHRFSTPLPLGALLKDGKNIVNRSSICRVTSASSDAMESLPVDTGLLQNAPRKPNPLRLVKRTFPTTNRALFNLFLNTNLMGLIQSIIVCRIFSDSKTPNNRVLLNPVMAQPITELSPSAYIQSPWSVFTSKVNKTEEIG
ncbi:MAG: hypothetical protein D9N14_04315 [Ketobacter sp.]|nr:MAG: hypothetical protein D9N14_04315 [Ketobacter sp.]